MKRKVGEKVMMINTWEMKRKLKINKNILYVTLGIELISLILMIFIDKLFAIIFVPAIIVLFTSYIQARSLKREISSRAAVQALLSSCLQSGSLQNKTQLLISVLSA